MMNTLRLIALVVIYVSEFASTDDDFPELHCKLIENGTPLYKLKRHLFCDYDPGIRPRYGAKNTTVVHALIVPENFKFNMHRGSMEMNSHTYVGWEDPFLTWNPKEHDDIKMIVVRRSEIWIPELYSLNPDGDMSGIPDTQCQLWNDGYISCSATIQYTVPCVSDYTHWPWDVHNCSLQMGASAYTGEDISFSHETGVAMKRHDETEEWKITRLGRGRTREKSKLSGNATFPMFTVSVLLRRTQTALKSVYFSPVIILTVVTLTVLWLRPGSTERLMLSCFNLLGHVIIIRHLHYSVPNTGNDVPNILIFYNNSLILSSLVLMLTCWLQKLLEWKREVPAWLASQVSVVLTSKIGQVLSINIMDTKGSALLQDDDDDNSGLVDSQSNNFNWENVVTVIGWLLLFSFGFIYFVMSLTLLY
ncbi:neuronal acetylcholine receptor subunit beta-3 isoform X2 [Diachasma alloeum]|uniref:neuronal acetylcholine receptor subunit beta-3 isoform X2 n=1 Tax=Diachasma alloeum TaxID=454923 RepID=UPI0007381963|nr:neuronal acetylcholine receptor subunit beta-3 isoform X2 [Diachasma alloeum]